ncbi:unnamed protein product [marine sediment metagenome]|uniref:Uncharacterized protein n=1 Tax=marine sediment metagenome TaxID=412755 RepID=X0SG57_9ZZZZ
MRKFMFETSFGEVICIADTSKPLLSSDPDWRDFVLSEGEIKVIKGQEHINRLYKWSDIYLKDGWIMVCLKDGYYGSPEYKITNLPLL